LRFSFVCQSLRLAQQAGKGQLLHVVSFKFKDTASKEQIKQVEDSFRDLKKKISEIKDYKWGTNVSPEKHDKVSLTDSFSPSTARRIAMPTWRIQTTRPLARCLSPVLADVFVIDFWTKE
jgi:hypothetical protein